MFGLDMLDVAVGVAVIYLLLSFVASALAELAESYLKFRSKDLRRGIRELLQQSDEKSPLVQAFYEHPLVASLYPGGYKTGTLPSYIPARTFALAFLDIAADPEAAAKKVTTAAGEVPVVGEKLKEIAERFTKSAAGDAEAARKEVEQWFDSSMDRVSGWFKRRTHRMMFAVGIVMAITLNIDSIRIIKYLNTNKAARQAIVNSAASISENVEQTGTPKERLQANLDELDRYGLPVGWEFLDDDKSEYTPQWIWFLRVLGWLMTAFAVSLGAPFWFDILNKIMVIRSTVKPREKSREEGSEDRQKKVA